MWLTIVTFTSVPVVDTAGPGELRTEGEEQVQKSPGQDDNIAHTAIQENQLASIANT